MNSDRFLPFLVAAFLLAVPCASAGPQDSFQVPGTSTQVRLWQEDGRHFYSLSLDGGGRWHPAREAEGVLKLRYREFDPVVEGEPPVPPGFASAPEARLRIVQFHTQTTEAYLQALRALGVEVQHFLPWQASLVRMDAAAEVAVRALPFVRWTGAYHPAYRMDGALLAALRDHGADVPPARYDIAVVDRHGNDKALLADAIRRIGGRVDTAPEGPSVMTATLTAEQARAAAAEDTLLWIEPWSEASEDMDLARIQGGADYIEPMKPERYTGKGIRGHIMEGVYRTHPEFAANAFRQLPIIAWNGTGTSHGNSTFGQIFSAGVQPQARGLLPDGQGSYTNYSAVINTDNRYPLVGELVNPSLQYRAMFQTASWGYAQVTEYTVRSQEMDEIIFDFDIPITQSQSNTGNQRSRPQAWAKNIISGGGIWHGNSLNTSTHRWTSASIGPAADGRVKPDLCAYYDGIYTTSSSTGYTTSFGGTSGATPIVAGHAGLQIEMYTDGIFGHPMPGGAAARFANRPPFVVTKAHLINTARQYEFPPASNIDRWRQGWGWPSVGDMYDLRDKTHIVSEWDVLRNLESTTYWFFVRPNEDQFRATLTWRDLPGTVTSTLHRINDMDLRVVAPSGAFYWGNNGLTAGKFSTAGGVRNRIDTVQNVFVQRPQAGLWRLDVVAAEINRDGHVATPAIDQAYGLVVSGIASGRNTAGVALQASTTGNGAGDLTIALQRLPAGWSRGYTLLSFDTQLPEGLGTTIGIQPDALSGACLAFAPAEGGLIAFTATQNPALFPNAAFQIPPGTLSALQGVSMDAVVVLFDAAGRLVDVSNASRVTF